MSSFSVAVKPVVEQLDHLPGDEDAVDLCESIDYSTENGGTYELHPLPGCFTERARRPSVVRNDSTADTITLGALAPEQSLTVLEDVHLKSRSVTETNTKVVVPATHHRAPAVESEGSLSKSYRREANLQLAAVCWSFFLGGWNDGTTGPLVPVIQESYHIDFATVSVLFVFTCSGFVLGAGTNVYLNERYGFGKIMFIGSLFQVVAYAMESPQPPFPIPRRACRFSMHLPSFC